MNNLRDVAQKIQARLKYTPTGFGYLTAFTSQKGKKLILGQFCKSFEPYMTPVHVPVWIVLW